jgi:hypothetical protein
MMRIFVLLALPLLLPPSLQAQFASGSVAVVETGGDYIAIAADSLRLGPAPGQVSHSACKIARLSGQLVFAATGVSDYPGTRNTPYSDAWSVRDIAEQEYLALAKKHTDHLIEKLAAAYAESLTSRINQRLKQLPEKELLTFVSSKKGGSAAVFAGFDEQRQRVIVEVTVGIRMPGAREVGYATKHLTGNETVGREIIGETAIAGELLAGKTERSQGWHSGMLLQSTGFGMRDRLLFGAERIVELTAKYDAYDVGGPIDEILVTRGRTAEWVHCKFSCGLKAHNRKLLVRPR